MSEQPTTLFNTLDALVQLIREELDLLPEHVTIYNQKSRLPNGDGLFVEIEPLSSRTISSGRNCDTDDAGNFCEFLFANKQETYAIKLFSRNEEALTRVPDVDMALHSTRAQQLCEQYNFNLGPLSTGATDTSAVEASARLFRQDLVVVVNRHYAKKRVISYFDRFSIPPNIHVNQ